MKIKGIVKNIVFESPDSLYKVLNVDLDNNENISITGYFPQIDELGFYEFEGETLIHPKYGIQFNCKNYISLNHTTKDGVINYLSSQKFKGVGIITAQNIVDTLGIDAIDKIKKDETCLLSVKGITKSKAHNIYEAVIQNENSEKIFIKLYSYGLTPHMANTIFSKYEELSITKIEENPYILIYDLSGFGFKRCDDLALKIGFKEDNPIRIKEAILFSIYEKIERTGDTFLTYEQVIDSSINLLNQRSENVSFNSDTINLYIEDLINDNRIIKVDNRIYPINLYKAELNSANKLKDLLDYKFKKVDTDKLKEYILDIENGMNIKLTNEQKKAIVKSLSNKVSIITGGPGTGKTTIMKVLLEAKARLLNLALHDSKFINSILLLSPTGRAAKRLQVQTGINASTIHKALEYNENGGFNKGENDKLSASLIIIDESSMIDIELLSHLLDATLISTQIIFIGDSDQLPSVGAGNVLYDLINSRLIPTSYLTEIMRQKEDSDIIKLASMVNNRNIDFSIFNNKKEVFFYQIDEINVIPLILKILDKYVETSGDLFYDMQLLAPMYSSKCGIDELNKQIQNHFNKSDKYIKVGEKIFKENDKVLQLVNNPELKIMNGDTGVIKMIQKTDDGTFLYIDFDSNIVKYPQALLSDLSLGYAISIHKSQGSEYKNIIMPIVSSFRIMLKKKLLYTAITRAKEKVIIIGNSKAFSSALYQNEDMRQTSLARLINPNLSYIKDSTDFESISYDKENKIDYIKINDSESAFDLIKENLNGITPFDCMKEFNGGKEND